jgi:hypothetical protein
VASVLRATDQIVKTNIFLPFGYFLDDIADNLSVNLTVLLQLLLFE